MTTETFCDTLYIEFFTYTCDTCVLPKMMVLIPNSPSKLGLDAIEGHKGQFQGHTYWLVNIFNTLYTKLLSVHVTHVLYLN